MDYYPHTKSLIVHQTADVHEQIAELLETLQHQLVETGCCEEAKSPQPRQAAPSVKP